MAAGDIVKIMESMGWTDGTFIPIANEENKSLMQAMQSLLAQKEQSSGAHQQVQQRVRNLNGRHKNAEQDIAQNSKLLDAHRSQLSDEHHMYKVSEYTDCSLLKRHKELLSNLADLGKHDKHTIDELANTNDAITKLSNKIHWTRDALAEWRGAMDRGDQTNKMIAKYCKQDEKNAQHLEAKRQSLQTDINRMQAALVNANEEQRSLESVLDRTAQLYRQAHQERRNLVDTWKDTVLSLRSREREMEANDQALEQMRLISARKNAQLAEEIEFLNLQIQNNAESEQDIAEQNAKITHTRSLLTAITDDVALKRNDSMTLKKLVQSLSAHLQQKRQQNRQATHELADKNAQLETLTANAEQLRLKFENFQNKNFSAQDRLRHLDELVEGEEKQLNSIASESARLGSALFRSSQMVITWRDEHKVIEMQIASLDSDIASEYSTVKHLQAELIRQMEIVYNIDFKTTVYESRLAKMKGAATAVNPELESKIKALETLTEEKRHTQELVKKQVLKIEDDMRLLTNSIGQATTELERLQNKLEFQRLEFEGGQKELATTTLHNQEQLVDQSMLKLRVHQMNEQLLQQRDKVYSLQRHQNDLQLAMNERLIEIKTRKELQLQAVKHLAEELAQLRADICERNLKIQAIQVRYENCVQRLGHNEDGSIVTATQIKIETAQEKQMLLRDGNELNERVLRAERDIKAIENTLLLLNYSNEAYKKTLEPITENNKEMQELNETTGRHTQLLAKIKGTKQVLAAKIKQLQHYGQQQLECEQRLELIGKARLENNDTLVRMHKEILDQRSKQERATRELKLARKTARSKIQDAAFFETFEQQLRVREMEGRNNAALQQLAEMVDEIVGMAPVVTKKLYEKGLSIPLRSAAGSQRSGQRSGAGSSSVSGGGGAGGGASSVGNLSALASASSTMSYGSQRSYGLSPPTSVRNSGRHCVAGPAIVTLGFGNEITGATKTGKSRHSK